MKIRFIHPTLAQILRGISYIVGIANLLLTYAATIQALSWVPPGLAIYYPLIFGAAFLVHQTASIFGIAPAPAFATLPSQFGLPVQVVPPIAQP